MYIIFDKGGRTVYTQSQAGKNIENIKHPVIQKDTEGSTLWGSSAYKLSVLTTVTPSINVSCIICLLFPIP